MTLGHHAHLAHGWNVWRWVGLRSAGFPAADSGRFAAPESGAIVDELFALADRERAVRDAAISACGAALDAAGPDDKKPLKKLLQRLRGGHVPDDTLLALDPLRDLAARIADRRRALDDTFARERRTSSTAIREIASAPAFREALVWQNRGAIATLLEPLLATPVDANDAPTRRKEAAIASYAQRYSVKNDTIGFFGPVGWAHVVDEDLVARVQPGPRLLDVRRVHFEYWCMDAIATMLAADPELRLDLAPRRMPSVRIDGTTIHFSIGRSAELPEEFLAVLVACDGVTPARAIAETNEDAVEILEELVEKRLVRWTLELPTAGQHPERFLRRELEKLPASEARGRAIATLDELEALRDVVARAAGDSHAVEQALRAFEEKFVALTGTEATRRAGETYAGRTLIYEETRRDVRVVLGTSFVERLGPPLALLATSARWYTHAVMSAYRPVFERTYRELGGGRVDYLRFLEKMLPQFAAQRDIAPIVRPIVDELHAKWLALLDPSGDAHRIERSATALADDVARAFAAPGPGWPQARYQSPDIMIAARGPDALARGDFVCVVGEIHTGMQTFSSVFHNLHPDPDAVTRAREIDLGRPLVATVEPRTTALRTDHVSFSSADFDIEMGDARSWRPADHVLAAAELVVVERDGRLVVCTRDGARSFDIVEVFEPYLVLASATHFSLLPRLPRAPRISIDNLVISRETWSFAPEEMAFVRDAGIERFIGARRWARHHGLPRFCFLRVPEEPKPCFVDLLSPIYLDILCRLVRQATAVTISEMLPAVDQAWLVDAEQRTFTAEMRMTLVDAERWRA